MDNDSSWTGSDGTSMNDDETLDGEMESDDIETDVHLDISDANDGKEHDSNEDDIDEPDDPDVPDNPNDPDNNADVDYGTSSIFGLHLGVKYAGKKVNRWKLNKPPSTRGKWMAQYLLFKMQKWHFHKKLKRDDYVKVGMALRTVDLEFIRQELLAHPATTDWAYNGVVQDQVLNFRVIHHDVRTMEQAGTPYLHHWVNNLVNRLFHEKVLYEIFYIRTPHVYEQNEWVACPFHIDLTDSPDEWRNRDLHGKAPISIYFPVGDTEVALDIKYAVKKKGRPRTNPTTRVVLKPGDVMFWNTATCEHRSAEPTPGLSVSDRVYIVLSGHKGVMQLDPPPGEPLADDVSLYDAEETDTLYDAEETDTE